METGYSDEKNHSRYAGVLEKTMRIAWLTPEIPFPPIGGRNGVYNRIVQLSKYNEIFLFSIAYSEEERATEYTMKKYCKEVHYYNRNESKIKKIWKSLFSPYSVASRTIPELQHDLNDVIIREKIDVIIVDFPNMAKNIFKVDCKNIYCTLNQHNNEYVRMREMYKIKTLPFYKRVAYYLESLRLESYEKKIYKKNLFKSITFFSIDDMKAFKDRWARLYNGKLELFPLGANLIDTSMKYENNKTMLFVGRLDSIATTNIEAVNWFVKSIFPKIVESVPDSKIIIAGANPTREICNMGNDNIKIIPNYDTLESVYSIADIVVLPLLSGGGVKGKLLEAAAFRKVIVSTNHGIEGTDFQPDKEVLLGNSEDEFAECCISAMKDMELSLSLSEKANELFRQKYDWNSIGEEYNVFLNKEICICSEPN